MVKDKRETKKRFLTHLDFQIGSSPLAAVEQSRFEILRMDKSVKLMMDSLLGIITDNQDSKNSEKLKEEVFDREEMLDQVQIEITTFLINLLSQPISHELAQEARSHLRLADEYESVSDYITNVLKLYLRLRDSDIELSDEQQKELKDLHESVAAYRDKVRGGLKRKVQGTFLSGIRKSSREITVKIRKLRDRHLKRLSKESVLPLISTTYMDIANAYRRMKDHLLNIGEAAVGGKSIGKASK